ncbi:hypothetical protein RRG08_010144 [Elysia crispata]|uniref:Uncharacterized protein n=1 Tax=Elysia crispata TaxID=231223 RepID=A0AAE1CVU7_9GAST|nr:hypothetical protein RRG08_010144 [Elysia crispata]
MESRFPPNPGVVTSSLTHRTRLDTDHHSGGSGQHLVIYLRDQKQWIGCSFVDLEERGVEVGLGFPFPQDEDANLYFPSASRQQPQDFAYLIVDPLKRTVVCFYHTFGSVAF